jgi:DNA-binding GntR family transcriptional regulator
VYTNIQSFANEPAQSAEWTAYQYLRREILSGRLSRGAPLNQEKIATELGLSRIPVRDAIRHLAAAGLVTIESNRRAVVTSLREGDLLELFQMRAVMEGLAVRHTVTNLTTDDLDHLTWLADRLNKTELIADQWIPIHEEFHDMLCSRSAMPMVTNEIRGLRQRVEPYVRVLISLRGAAELRISRHNSLISVIRSRDPERAECAIREHIMWAAKEIVASLRSSAWGAVDVKPDESAKKTSRTSKRRAAG